ncbi:hypothetical protein E5343_06940 [Rodentibacter caecimuris]|uniref:hypothetical protein n=1 Tax=Rodentibacter caecimuris TaxID=1796644 RepID=UPI001094BC28|nr:hypothetical protein [Pasteurella caecimuris]TGY49711.1 hypothetical protein E5343_06940 [Pasteurella caecimuris]
MKQKIKQILAKLPMQKIEKSVSWIIKAVDISVKLVFVGDALFILGGLCNLYDLNEKTVVVAGLIYVMFWLLRLEIVLTKLEGRNGVRITHTHKKEDGEIVKSEWNAKLWDR